MSGGQKINKKWNLNRIPDINFSVLDLYRQVVWDEKLADFIDMSRLFSLEN